MEEAARVVMKAFTACVTDRFASPSFFLYNHAQKLVRSSPPDRSRKWGVYYVAGLVFKCYFRVWEEYCIFISALLNILQLKRISLTKNILRALEVNQDIPSLEHYPRAHRVRPLPSALIADR